MFIFVWFCVKSTGSSPEYSGEDDIVKNMIILFFGDIIGKLGRRAIQKVLPELKKEYQPDLVMANVENLAHGKGVTEKTLAEMLAAGIDIFTSGNHVTKKGEYGKILSDEKFPLIRPANYPPAVPGRGYIKLKIKNKNVFVTNLIGRVFMHENFDCPFRKFDELKKLLKLKKNDIIIIDFHAEATSEKNAFAQYVDGQVSAVLGTHTHVPTADGKILPAGTGYISDIGMVGALDSIIGVKKEIVIEQFLTQINQKHEFPETGLTEMDAVLVEIDEKTGKCVSIKRIKKEVTI